MSKKLQEQQQIVVVTGANSGIGFSLVEEYLKQGARVASLDIKEDKINELIQKNPKWAFQIQSYQVDVSNEKEIQDVGEKILSELGQPTIWINNAGIAVLGDFEKIPSQDFNRVLEVNLNGVIYGTRVALNLMKHPVRGTIANVSSVNDRVPAPFMTAYVTAKHAVTGFTRALREEKEQAHSPIQIVLICPGFVRTQIMESNPDFKFPTWLSGLIEEPAQVAREIVNGIQAGKKEIAPTLHGKLLLNLHRVAPQTTARSSRLLVAKNWKQILGLSPIRK